MILEKLILAKIVCPTVTTQDILTSAMADFGIDEVAAKTLAGVNIVAKTTSAGVGQAIDDKISISGSNIVINEGSTGFVTGDIFYIALRIGNATLPSSTATASTTPT